MVEWLRGEVLPKDPARLGVLIMDIVTPELVRAVFETNSFA